MPRLLRYLALGLIVSTGQITVAIASDAANVEWTRQFGGPLSDVAISVAADATGVYVAGSTRSVLSSADGVPQANTGGRDAVLRKYDPAGNEVWTRQFGTTATDTANFVSVNAVGDVCVTGTAASALPGQSSAGAYVRKYDASGNVLWTRQFGGTSTHGYAIACNGPSGDIYIVGEVDFAALPGQTSSGGFDAFVRKYDAAGNEAWTHQFGTSSLTITRAVAVDPISGGVYVGGYVFGVLPGQTSAGRNDVFLRKYDAAGNELWTHQFGTPTYAYGDDVSADSAGFVYIGGYVAAGDVLPGQVASGGEDAFVRKYDSDGNEVWTRQFGTSFDDAVLGVSAGFGAVFVSGNTFGGAFPGFVNAGDGDAFSRGYDAAGNELWTQQIGSTALDHGWGISNHDSAVYLTGDAGAALPGQTSAGGMDAFVVKISLPSDTTPPTITVPADITAEATSPNGAVIEFTASANDDVDGPTPVSCTPPSGSMFPIGATTVTCTSVDAHGNSASASFTITVLGASEIVSGLIARATVDNFQQAIGLLQNALRSINTGNSNSTCGQLNAFLNQIGAQSGKKLPRSEAAALMSSAIDARGSLACR